ncbi:MAG: hypothetical protein LBT98_01960 [Puniceicoccales bacterium]|nr:hypothetical protein [Puniceicoccales bacterium]
MVIPTWRKIAQHIGILITTLALAAAVVTVVLFLATAIVPLAFLWPTAIACGCVALIGLIAYGIARHGDCGDWWEYLWDMPSWMRERMLKRIYTVENKLDIKQRNLTIFEMINSWSQYDGNTDPDVWKRMVSALEILPNRFIKDISSQVERNPILPLFQYCKDSSVLVRVLKLFQKRLFPKRLWAGLLETPHGELYKKIAALASENKAVGQAWNKLLRHAGPKPAELN